MSSEQRFSATVESGERGRVFVRIPFDPNEVWGKKARHYVRGTLAGTPFETSLGARGGVVFFPIGKELRATAGVDVGSTVKVVIVPTEATSVGPPEDLDAALRRSKAARAFFDGLTPFARNQWIGWITSAKREETRKGRVAKAVKQLAAEQKLPR
jgi:hypothetical protein